MGGMFPSTAKKTFPDGSITIGFSEYELDGREI